MPEKDLTAAADAIAVPATSTQRTKILTALVTNPQARDTIVT